MRIKKVIIDNFRSISHLEANFLPYMVFVGKNNSGKSNLMKAIDAFFHDDIQLIDFRKEGDTTHNALSITIIFSELSDHEKEYFDIMIYDKEKPTERLILKLTAHLDEETESIKSRYWYGKDTLKLESDAAKNRYSGLLDDKLYKKRSNIENCNEIPQEFKDRALEFLDNKSSSKFTKAEYFKLRTEFLRELKDSVPNIFVLDFAKRTGNKTAFSEALGNFFFIPAVQDIEDETRYTSRGKKNLNLLMNFILKRTDDPVVRRQKEEEIRNILKEIYKIGAQGSEMSSLQDVLNEQINTFDKSKVVFDAKLPDIDKLVRDSLKVYIDDGIRTEAQYKGHGLQRYFMVILFKVWSQKLTEQMNKKHDQDADEVGPTTYFAIEEPELFLHPQYQRMMLSYLQNIATDEGHQVILNTHSPHFIEFNYLLQVATVIKRNISEGTKIVQPLEFDQQGNIIEKEFLHTWGSVEQQEHFGKLYRVNMNFYLNPNRNELFFADKVVLTEGQTEAMLFSAWANYFFPGDAALLNRITYIDCLGKNHVQQYIKIMEEFKIPFVTIIDTDDRDGRGTPPDFRHIKNNTLNAGGKFFSLHPDFEGQFDIEDAEYDSATHKKKHKPFYAFMQFFEEDGTPKEAELENLRNNQKLVDLFKEIYGKDISHTL